MTVEQLIKKLEKYDKDLEIVIQEDEEGNGYHFAYAVSLSIDDMRNGYPPVDNVDEYYESDEEIPEDKVVVIV